MYWFVLASKKRIEQKMIATMWAKNVDTRVNKQIIEMPLKAMSLSCVGTGI